MYWDFTELGLHEICIPLDAVNCKNPMCDNKNHIESITKYYSILIYMLQQGSSLIFENNFVSPAKSKKTDFKWTEELNSLHSLSKNAYDNWIKGTKPNSGYLYEQMCTTRKNFKFARRKQKQKSKQELADGLASSMIRNHPTRNFWQQIQLLNNLQSKHANSHTINGVSGAENISNLWKNHYCDLLNSKWSSHSLHNGCYDISSVVTDQKCYAEFDQQFCTVALAKMLSSKLKLNSAAGSDGLMAEHILLSHESVYFHVS